MKKVALSFVAGSICFLTACTEDNSIITSTTKVESEELYASLDDVPDCTPKLKGQSVAVQEENAFFECNGDRWVRNRGDSDSVEEDHSILMSSSSGKWRLENSDDPDAGWDAPFDIVSPSSSSLAIEIVGEPWTPSLSSSSVQHVADLGVCQPETNPIDKGESVRWRFSANLSSGYKPIDFAKATYEWFFEDGAPSSDQTPSASTPVTYTKTGLTQASLVININGAVGMISCSPLQVNGDPISCECTATGGDITKDGGKAVWAASCTSLSPITGYVWEGIDFGAEVTTFSHSFSAKGDTFAPTLVVGNSDNTVQTVTCPTVVATDASDPDYVMEEGEDLVFPAGDHEVYLSFMKDYASSSGSVYFSCSANEPLEMSINGVDALGAYLVTIELPFSNVGKDGFVSLSTNVETACWANLLL